MARNQERLLDSRVRESCLKTIRSRNRLNASAIRSMWRRLQKPKRSPLPHRGGRRPKSPQINAPTQSALVSPSDWRPKRLVRTVLSSMAASTEFGKQMSREAKRRRFSEAVAKAFLGDGLPWNWSIQKRYFSDYVAILDFIHPLSYLFVTAKAVHTKADDAWSQYVVWMRGAWRGEIAQVLEELRQWKRKLGEPPEDALEQDPRQIVASTVTYLDNNKGRMNYPEYRRQGLPITTAWMESLVKEINYRVKGTEMFWNDPEGAEAILQVRAAALSDDQRLAKHLQSRPGCAFTRRPKQPMFAEEKNKS